MWLHTLQYLNLRDILFRVSFFFRLVAKIDEESPPNWNDRDKSTTNDIQVERVLRFTVFLKDAMAQLNRSSVVILRNKK